MYCAICHSALDAHVSKHIFEQVIGPDGCLKHRTRLLVTHKLSLLTQVDQIIYLEKGKIEETGSFAELIAAKGAFSEYVAEYFLDKATAANNSLDEDDIKFMSSVEPQLKNVIEKLEFSRSTSHNRKVSSEGSRHHSSRALSIQHSNRNQSNSIADSNRSNRAVLTSANGKLIQAEGMAEGSVNISNHKKYFATIGYFMCFAILLSLALSNVFQVFGSLWLSDWSNDALDPELATNVQQRNKRVIVYAIFGIIESLFSFVGTLAINLGCVDAAKVLHNKMLSGILRAPMQFFGKRPVGA